MKHTIDATGKTLGRIASDVAMLLMGKRSPSYRPNVVTTDAVCVANLSKARFTGTKMTKKLYWRFSGYPGGLTNATLGVLWEKDPAAIFSRIVAGMLPKNTLRPKMLKRLQIIL